MGVQEAKDRKDAKDVTKRMADGCCGLIWSNLVEFSRIWSKWQGGIGGAGRRWEREAMRLAAQREWNAKLNEWVRINFV
jgi:hypothetical protein